MAYPEQAAAVFVHGQHVVLLEAAGFGIDVVGLGFGIDDDEAAAGGYVELVLIVVVHVVHKEFFGAVEDGVELAGFGVQPL